MSDIQRMSYKDRIQEIAEDIAYLRFGKDFYDLSEEEKDRIYEEATRNYTESSIP